MGTCIVVHLDIAKSQKYKFKKPYEILDNIILNPNFSLRLTTSCLSIIIFHLNHYRMMKESIPGASVSIHSDMTTINRSTLNRI